MSMRIFLGILLLVPISAALAAAEVKLAWDAQAGVADYRVWRGIECLATVPENAATLTLPDEACTITVTARNAAGESPHSVPLELIAITVQQSADLKAWAAVRTIHREKGSSAFYRLKLEVTP